MIDMTDFTFEVFERTVNDTYYFINFHIDFLLSLTGVNTLPERFCTIAPDTVGRTFWSDDPVLSPSLRHNSDGTPVVAERAVIWTDGSIDTADCVPVAH
jgi:hypothetical protein